MKTTKLWPILLAIAICVTGCGKKNSTLPEGNESQSVTNLSISRFVELGDLELETPAQFDDGMIRFSYDGNYFLPAQLVSPDDNFRELTIIQTDLRETEKNTVYGYLYYSTGNFGQDIDEVVTSEESYAFPGITEEFERTEYLQKSDSNIGYTYEYIENGVQKYAILIVKNETDKNGCFIGMISSDMKEAIDKAKEMFETVEIYGENQIDSMIQSSFSRTEKIYALLVPNTETDTIHEKYSEEKILESLNEGSPIKFKDLSYDLTVGETFTPELIGRENCEHIYFTSTNEAVAAVDDNGEITAASEGLAVIVASTQEGKIASIYVNVFESEGDVQK